MARVKTDAEQLASATLKNDINAIIELCSKNSELVYSRFDPPVAKWVTPLILAAREKTTTSETIAALISGADDSITDVQTHVWYAQDSLGQNALIAANAARQHQHTAAIFEGYEAALEDFPKDEYEEFFLSIFIDKLTDMWGWSALHYSARYAFDPKALEATKLIVEKGGDINLPASELNTPAHLYTKAITEKLLKQSKSLDRLEGDELASYVAPMKELINLGADISLKNKEGKTAIEGFPLQAQQEIRRHYQQKQSIASGIAMEGVTQAASITAKQDAEERKEPAKAEEKEDVPMSFVDRVGQRPTAAPSHVQSLAARAGGSASHSL